MECEFMLMFGGIFEILKQLSFALATETRHESERA
jgi:hypothetical protein